MMGRMKNMYDQLALVGSPISNLESVMYTVKGLNNDYNPIVVVLLGKDPLGLSVKPLFFLLKVVWSNKIKTSPPSHSNSPLM